MARTLFQTTFALLLIAVGNGPAQAQEPVRSAHENLEPGTETDDLGITIPIPASHPARRYPASDEFPTGPEIGERLPTSMGVWSTTTRIGATRNLSWCSTGRPCGDRTAARSWSSCKTT